MYIYIYILHQIYYIRHELVCLIYYICIYIYIYIYMYTPNLLRHELVCLMFNERY